MRRATTAVLLTAALALAGCTGSTDDKTAADKPSTATAAATPATTPSLSQDEVARQCSDAIAEAAPGWQDWNYSPGGWQNDPRTPEVCQSLADEEYPARGNRAFMDALLDGLERADDPRAGQ